MADSSNANDRFAAHTVSPAHTDRPSAAPGPVGWAVWFARTRPWLTGSAVLCTVLLALVIALEPGRGRKAGFDVAEDDFALLDDVNVFYSGSREEGQLQVTEPPLLLSPSPTPTGVVASTGAVVQAGYTTADHIDVIRPVEYQSSLSRGPQGAWLTGEIEEPAGSPFKRSAQIASPPAR